MHEFFSLLQISGRVRYFIVLTVLRIPFDTVRTVLIAVFAQLAFDTINTGNIKALYCACLYYGVGNLLLFLYNGIIWSLYATQYTKWIAAIRRKMFAHISGYSLQQIESRPSGDWITNLNSDVRSAAMILGHPAQLHQAGAMLLSILISSVMLVFINSTMYVCIILFVIPQVLLSQIIAKPMTGLAAAAKDATANNATAMNAIITCADTAILYDAEGLLLSRFEHSSKQIRAFNMQMRRRRAILDALLPLLGMSGYLPLLILGGMLIAQDQMTFGALTSIFQYRGGVMACAMILTTCIVNIKISLASIRRVNKTMQIPLEV